MGVSVNLNAAKALLKNALRPGIVKVNIAVTYACNYRCKTCNIWRLYLDKPELKSMELSYKEHEELYRENRDVVWLSFTGGEPFLREDFDDIVTSAVENIRGLKLINVATNGSMPVKVKRLVEKVLSARPDLLLFVEVSLDGCEKLHNYVRGFPQAYRNSLETFRRLRRLKAEGLNVRFEYTLSRFNAGLLRKLLEDLNSQGLHVSVDDFVVTLAHNSPYYNNEEMGSIAPPMDKAIDELSWISSKLSKRSLLNLVPLIYLKLSSRFFKGWRPPCVAGSHSCFIDPFGRVYPCITVRYELADLRRDGFNLKQAFSGPRARFFRENLRPRCPTCWTPCEAYQSIVFKPLGFLPYLLS